MPSVNGKKFAYTAKGKAAAKAAAKGKGAGVPSTDRKGSGGVWPQPPAKKQK